MRRQRAAQPYVISDPSTLNMSESTTDPLRHRFNQPSLGMKLPLGSTSADKQQGVELQPLLHGAKPPSDRSRSTTPQPSENHDEPTDESAGWWAWATAGWLVTLAIPLLLFPRLLLFMASPTGTPDHEVRELMTPLENFMATHVGIGLLAVALALITSIPSPAPLAKPQEITRHPLLFPLTSGLCLTAFIAYNTKSVGAPLTTIISLGSGVTGLWGFWVIMFEGSSLISKKTGADKRTSSWLFSNKASASHQKKLWKQERKREEEWELQQRRR